MSEVKISAPIEYDPIIWQEGWSKHLEIAQRVFGSQDKSLEILNRLPIPCQDKCKLLLELMGHEDKCKQIMDEEEKDSCN